MRILITGDVSTYNINPFKASNIKPKFIDCIKNADLAVYNLEGPIVPSNLRMALSYRSNFLLHGIFKYGVKLIGKEQPIVISDESILSLLNLNRNTVVTLANNHIKDGGKKAMKYMMDLLRQEGIKYLGAGLTNSEAIQPLPVTSEHGGIVLLNLNWVSSREYFLPLRLYNATTSDYGGAYLDFNSLKKSVYELRKNFRHVILILHHGKMMIRGNKEPGIEYDKLAKLDVAAVIIHHPHVYVPNPYEKSKNIVLIGDFIFRDPNYLPDLSRPSALVTISIESERFDLNVEEFKVNDVYAYQEG
jgi:poly-gamma-glutamate capsule biosynthesis protein CapA/YwtB (metallophosphatase superfamily)